VCGTDTLLSEETYIMTSPPDAMNAADPVRQDPNVRDFSFLIVDETGKTITVKPGVWRVDKNMIIPGGYTFVCVENTTLDLSNAASILSYSPLSFTGSGEYPVIITSSDSTGQGLAVLHAGGRSLMDHVVCENLANPSSRGWELTGAVTFYESPVTISNAAFSSNRSEDAVNMFRTAFTIDNTFFSSVSSDALDADFCTGEITNSSFTGCVNDAIDVSGSVITLDNIAINGAGDKGVSSGEDSRTTVNRLKIVHANVGIASKDFSEVTGAGIDISGCAVGLACFQKKPEFGPGTITVSHLTIDNTPAPYVVEEGSRLTVNGKTIPANSTNVKAILYDNEYSAGGQPRR